MIILRENGCFLKENFEYYVGNSYYSYDTFQEQLKLIKDKLFESNCVIMSVEERTPDKIERICIPISYVDDEFIGEGYKFFDINGEEVFRYYHRRNLGIYYDDAQLLEYHFIKQGKMSFDEEWLRFVVDYAYEDYYGKAQNWFGTGDDLKQFCDKLYMDEESRLILEKLVLRKKMSNFKENYGYDNPLLNDKLEELNL